MKTFVNEHLSSRMYKYFCKTKGFVIVQDYKITIGLGNVQFT